MFFMNIDTSGGQMPDWNTIFNTVVSSNIITNQMRGISFERIMLIPPGKTCRIFEPSEAALEYY